jgi:hypothetical protein
MKRYAYASASPGPDLPTNNAGCASRAIYESIASKDQTSEVRPDRGSFNDGSR